MCKCPAYKHIKEKYVNLFTDFTIAQRMMEKADHNTLAKAGSSTKTYEFIPYITRQDATERLPWTQTPPLITCKVIIERSKECQWKWRLRVPEFKALIHLGYPVPVTTTHPICILQTISRNIRGTRIKIIIIDLSETSTFYICFDVDNLNSTVFVIMISFHGLISASRRH